MKNIFRILGLILMVGVLAGGVYLAQKNQETRRGATQAQTVSSIIPNKIENATVGQEVTLTLMVDTGQVTDKMSGGEVKVEYDRTKLKYESLEMVTPFFLADNKVDGGSGPLAINYVSTSEIKGGASQVAKIKFSVLATTNNTVKASGSILIQEPTLAMWTLVTNNDSEVIFGENGSSDGTPVPSATTVPVATVTSTPSGGCSSNSECSSDKACLNGECDLPVCSQSAGTCTKYVFENHSCSVVADDAKNEATCNINSVTTGKCDNGVCKSVADTAECSQNSDCALDKRCSGEGTCVVPICTSTVTSCTKLNYEDHACSVVADTSKNGQSCQYNSLLTGMCDNGTCKEPVTIPEGKGKITFKTAYRGFASGAKCGLNQKLKVVLRKENGDLVEFNDVPINSSGLSEVVADAGSKMSLFVKGSQHLQMKYSVDGQSSRYTSVGGELETGKTYDFTKYPMLPGDVNSDGWINGLDFSIVKTKAMKYEDVAEGSYLVGDLDGTCQVNTRDLTLLVNSLDEKQDELY